MDNLATRTHCVNIALIYLFIYLASTIRDKRGGGGGESRKQKPTLLSCEPFIPFSFFPLLLRKGVFKKLLGSPYPTVACMHMDHGGAQTAGYVGRTISYASAGNEGRPWFLIIRLNSVFHTSLACLWRNVHPAVLLTGQLYSFLKKGSFLTLV